MKAVISDFNYLMGRKKQQLCSDLTETFIIKKADKLDLGKSLHSKGQHTEDSNVIKSLKSHKGDIYIYFLNSTAGHLFH